MAGIKTGSLFSCSFASREELTSDLKKYNELFAPRGLFLIPLKIMGNKAMLYLFRRNELQRDLLQGETSSMLGSFGYTSSNYKSCLSRLVRRLKVTEGFEFPHEIGLFLSYPPEDVRGFVENHAGGCKLVGYWKVYGDEKAARRIFNEYDMCTSDYRARVRKGVSLDRLIVPCAG